MNQIEEFNSLSKQLADGQIGEAEFQQALIDRLGYDRAETVAVIKNMRRVKREVAS